VRPGGLVSIIVSNPVIHVLRAAVRDLDPAGALQMLGSAGFRTQTFEHTVRRITWQRGAAALDLAGAEVVARYGVLCVNHLVTDDERKQDPEFFADLARLELALADQDPYRDIAAMWMIVARRR
jgi:S-adenosylmethionine-dependent methyltransferase